MTTSDEPRFPRRGVHGAVARYLEAMPDLAGKVVVDIPCGDGRASAIFHRKGALVRALDLFPGAMRASGIVAEAADMSATLPVADASADVVLCQEGIEHVPDQLHLLAELNRVLKPGGLLILTTPSLSHMRARLAQLAFESDSLRRMPPNEQEGILVAGSSVDQIYFGHLFLRGVQHLRAIMSLSGFKVRRRLWTDLTLSSLLMGVLLYPLLLLATAFTMIRHRLKQRGVPGPALAQIWREQALINLSPTTLFCRHVFWEMQKVAGVRERRGEILGLGTGIGPYRQAR
jgi:SAM-dependent methyltransferase